MKVPSFIGGEDTQRSLNLSDNKCINLYPTTNSDGTITGFYKVDGLKQEAVLAGIPTGAYKTSTNRAFYVTGTTLYELTSSLTSVSRGTLTAGNYDFSDNGIELICVNGTDGWLFVLATNTLTQIKVLTADFTVTVASPAVITSVAHGLVAGDRVIFSSTGVLPSGLTTTTPYYVISAGLTANAFEVSLTEGGTAINTANYIDPIECTMINTLSQSACTISNATPAVVTQVAHGRKKGDRISFTTLGTLPSPLVSTPTVYYVLSSGLTADEFQISTVENGTAVNTTTAGAGVHYLNPPQNGRIILDSSTFDIGDEIRFYTTGALPTGITANTIYYVSAQEGSWTALAGKLILNCNSGTLKIGTAVKFYINAAGTLPSGVVQDTQYYLLDHGDVAGDSNRYQISLTQGGTAIALGTIPNDGYRTLVIESSNISISSTEANAKFGTLITISGTQSGTHTYVKESWLPYGTHTFLTLGYGFPNGCTTIDYMNGRFIACEPNTQNFYVSEVLDGWYWDALNVQTVDSNPDYVTGQIVSHNELIVFCETSGEVFYDSGTIPTPFIRNASGIFEIGCTAPFTIANLDNSVFWLGQSQEGKGCVYRLNGYNPIKISSYSIEQAINAMTTISDAKAFTYQKEGHHFYVLTFPTEGKTFVFDANTNLWHERASFISSVLGRWEPKDHLFFNGVHYVTDALSTNLYSIDEDTYSNGTNPCKVIRSFRAPESEMKRVRHSALEVEGEFGIGSVAGSDPQLMLRWSDDSHTWSNLKTKSLGKIGEYAKNVIFRRLGITKGPSRVYEISCSEDVKLMLKNVYLE